MRCALRWLSRLLPPGYAVALAVVMYLACEMLAFWVAGSFGRFLRADDRSAQEIFKVRDVVLITAALTYGLWRVAAFHPFYRPFYAEWLDTTPWSNRHPLPLGPIHLAVQDLVVAAIMMAAMHSSHADRAWIPAMLLTAHGMAAGAAMFWTGQRAISYAIGFLLGLLVLLSWEPNLALAVAVALSLVAHVGIRSSLASFPWETREGVTRFLLALSGRLGEMPKQSLGYPFDGLSPRPPQPAIPLRDGIALSLLPAWWAYALLVLGPKDEFAPIVGVACVYLLPVCVVGRVSVYLNTCRPPISFWGRILTGRWIIPGFDRALAAPLLATVLGIGLPIGGLYYHVPLKMVIPACITAILMVTLNVGPSLSVWRLTGAYRLVPHRDRKNLAEL